MSVPLIIHKEVTPNKIRKTAKLIKNANNGLDGIPIIRPSNVIPDSEIGNPIIIRIC